MRARAAALEGPIAPLVVAHLCLVAQLRLAVRAVSSVRLVAGGQGKYRYQYMPQLLQAPTGASLVNCHGLVTDAEGNIYLTYQNDGTDKNCLIRWKPDGSLRDPSDRECSQRLESESLCLRDSHRTATRDGAVTSYHAATSGWDLPQVPEASSSPAKHQSCATERRMASSLRTRMARCTCTTPTTTRS